MATYGEMKAMIETAVGASRMQDLKILTGSVAGIEFSEREGNRVDLVIRDSKRGNTIVGRVSASGFATEIGAELKRMFSDLAEQARLAQAARRRFSAFS